MPAYSREWSECEMAMGAAPRNAGGGGPRREPAAADRARAASPLRRSSVAHLDALSCARCRRRNPSTAGNAPHHREGAKIEGSGETTIKKRTTLFAGLQAPTAAARSRHDGQGRPHCIVHCTVTVVVPRYTRRIRSAVYIHTEKSDREKNIDSSRSSGVLRDVDCCFQTSKFIYSLFERDRRTQTE